ncbi:MAG: DUF2089 domain-containing protein [Archangiaceae bacterium]|nr:DUF2089 domain-containing protein [Archangiaceae bacterium]
MTKLPTTCPACAESLEVARLTCPGCAMQLEGRFELPALLRLSPDDASFVLDFVRCSGSLKDLGQLRKQSYPTLRARLDEIVARLTPAAADGTELKRKQVLDALAKGELNVKEATRKLKELGS